MPYLNKIVNLLSLVKIYRDEDGNKYYKTWRSHEPMPLFKKSNKKKGTSKDNFYPLNTDT